MHSLRPHSPAYRWDETQLLLVVDNHIRSPFYPQKAPWMRPSPNQKRWSRALTGVDANACQRILPLGISLRHRLMSCKVTPRLICRTLQADAKASKTASSTLDGDHKLYLSLAEALCALRSRRNQPNINARNCFAQAFDK